MLIDKTTGKLHLYADAYDCQPLEPGLSKDQFEESALGARVVKLRMSQLPWESYKLPPVSFEDWMALGMILFYSGLVKRIEFSLCAPHLVGNRSWEDYSEDEEADRKRLHDGILLRELGGPHERKRFPASQSESSPATISLKTPIMYRFRWGTVWSGHDSRGGSTFIRVDYGRPKIAPSNPLVKAYRDFQGRKELAKRWKEGA